MLGTIEAARIVLAAQIRGARGMLRWSSADLATHAKVANGTVVRIEAGLGVRADSAEAITRALQDAGVEFRPDGWVRLKPAAASRAARG